jgi:hypothetical protein
MHLTLYHHDYDHNHERNHILPNTTGKRSGMRMGADELAMEPPRSGRRPSS